MFQISFKLVNRINNKASDVSLTHKIYWIVIYLFIYFFFFLGGGSNKHWLVDCKTLCFIYNHSIINSFENKLYLKILYTWWDNGYT